jgi:hypothetical protein
VSELEQLTRKLVKLAMEKRLRNELDAVAPELPYEVREEIYYRLYRPVMVNFMVVLRRSMENVKPRSV